MTDVKQLQDAVNTLSARVSRDAATFERSIAKVDTARQQLREIAGVPASSANSGATQEESSGQS